MVRKRRISREADNHLAIILYENVAPVIETTYVPGHTIEAGYTNKNVNHDHCLVSGFG